MIINPGIPLNSPTNPLITHLIIQPFVTELSHSAAGCSLQFIRTLSTHRTFNFRHCDWEFKNKETTSTAVGSLSFSLCSVHSSSLHNTSSLPPKLVIHCWTNSERDWYELCGSWRGRRRVSILIPLVLLFVAMRNDNQVRALLCLSETNCIRCCAAARTGKSHSLPNGGITGK